MITAKTQTNRVVTINCVDVIVEDGKPVFMLFVKDEDGQHAIFNHMELHDFKDE